MKQKCSFGALRTSSGMNQVSRQQSKKCHYFGIVLLLFTFLSFSSLAQAQLSNGAIVTISSGNNFLATNGSNLTNVTTVSINALWEVSVTTVSGTTRYAFKNVVTNSYLRIQQSWWNYNLTLQSNISDESRWTLEGKKLKNVYHNNYFLRYNNQWQASTSSTNLTFNSYTKNESFLYSGANPLVFAAAGETKSVTLSAFPNYTSGTTVIPAYTYAILGSGFTPSQNNNTINVVAAENTSSARTGTLTVTSTINSDTKLSINLTQAAALARFNHQQGLSGRPMVDNGYGKIMQGVHEQRFVVYAPQNSSRVLEIPERSMSYSRWYNYATDETETGLSTISGYSAIYGGKGFVKCSNSTNQNTVVDATYKHTSSAVSGVIAEVACDLSYYNDYTGTQSDLRVEPTLSHRMVYEIRPAMEMATALSSCTGTKFLEEYTIIAPAGQTLRFGPKYKYDGDNSNYYYLSGGNPTQVTSGSWTASSGAAPSNLQNNRVVQVAGGADGVTRTYELKANGYNIAKVTVKYMSVDKIGPKNGTGIMSAAELRTNYQYITGLFFDGDKNSPLEWDESSYGFFYPNNTSGRSSAYWSEYELMNITTSAYTWLKADIRDMLYQNSGSTAGNFLYVDASSSPGVVANLRFKESGLCPGTRMYVSAWVNNLGVGTNPNLNFSIVGILGGVETDITTYTTGDLNSGSEQGVWKQIFFEVEMPDVDFDDYRLRIVNNAQNASGNDFAIDDICVYMQKPALMVYQADVACPDANSNSAAETIMIRLDPDGFDFSNNVQDIYYQLQDEAGNAMKLKNYVSNSSLPLNSQYGQIKLAKTGQKVIYKTYSSLTAYKDSLNNNPSIENVFIVSEVDAKGVSHDIYYVLHTTDSTFKMGGTYYCVIATEANDLDRSTSNCGMSSSFKLQPQSVLVVNGELIDENTTANVCGNQFNTIAIKMYGASSDLTQIFDGTCRYDWLNGKKDDYSDNGVYGGYDYNAIVDAILALRIADARASDVAAINATNLKDSEKSLLTELVSRGMLELNKEEIKRRLPLGATYFTLFPIAASAVNSNNEPIHVCERPFVITLQADGSSRSFQIGKDNETDIPSDVMAKRVVRLDLNTVTTTPLQLPITGLKNITSTDLQSTSGSSKVYLIRSTDNDASLPIDDGTELNNVYTSIGFSAQGDNQLVMSLDNRNSAMKFKAGHRYDFMVMLPLVGDESCATGAYFTIVVVPEYVMWAPRNASTSWHRDNNWVMIDNMGNVDNSGNGYVPLASTNALMPASTSVVLKAVNGGKSYPDVTDNAQFNIQYDLNFVANSCRGIHIGAHSLLGSQHLLNYSNAWVDMPLTVGQWNLIAPPFEGMVTGDMYIPSSGVHSNPLFGDVDSPDSRGVYRMYTSFYNSKEEAYTMDRNGDTLRLNASEWTAPFNALVTPINVGMGYSIFPENNNNSDSEVIVRLPKADTQYFYYGSYGEQTSMFETVERPQGGHKLAGTAGKEIIVEFNLANSFETRTHLLANPYLCELDIEKFMNHKDNFMNLTGSYEILNGGDRSTITVNPNGVSSDPTIAYDSVINIPPMTSFLVHIDDEATAPSLKISPSMMIDLDVQKSSAPMKSSRSALNANKSQLFVTATRNGLTSHCSVVEMEGASNEFDRYEDSRLSLLSSAMTPAAVFTSASNTAMSINIVSTLDMIPLGIAIQDELETESLTLTFNGVNNFDGHLMLYDAKSGARQSLVDGITLSLLELADDNSRYYICYVPQAPTELESVVEDGVIKVYQPVNGQVVVASSNYIQTIRIYGVNGQLIMERGSLNSLTEEITLHSGVYVVDVTTENGVSREKVIIR